MTDGSTASPALLHVALARILIGLLLILATPAAISAPESSPVAAPGPLSRADAEQLLTVLKDPEQRARFTATLEAYVRAAPLVPPQKGSNAAAAAASPRPPAHAESAIGRTLDSIIAVATGFADHIAADFRNLTDWATLDGWIHAELSQPEVRQQAANAAVRVGLIALSVLALELLLRKLYRPKSFAAPNSSAPPKHAGERWIRAFHRMSRGLIILIATGIFGNGVILGLLADYPTARSIAFGLVNAYLSVRLVMSVAAAFFSPADASARLVAVSDITATRATRSVRALAVTIAFGLVGSEIAALLGASAQVHDSAQKLVGLLVHALLIVIVIRSRELVGEWIRRRFGKAKSLSRVGEALAVAWPVIAVTGIAAWWLVGAMDIPDGYERILRYVLATAGVLVVSQFVTGSVLGAIDRRLTPIASESSRFPGRIAGYRRPILAATQITLIFVTLVILMQAWGVDTLLWFSEGHLGNRLGILVLKLLLLAVLGVACWELVDGAVDARVAHLTAASALARAGRLRTLQPIVRVTLIVLLTLVFLLTALSEIGFNIGPLLAGASIFGVALGFGSQKLVQDFITGIFLLVEDAMDVGDWVTVAGLSGSVEQLSIRTIRLRAGDGSVHLIPFSAVTSVTNTNRGVGNAAVSVTIDACEDTDRVAAVLEEIVRGMRDDPAFGPSIQSDLQLWGVDKLDGSLVTIVGQIVCTDAGRWPVQREFNRRVKKRFDQAHIALGIPEQALRIERSRSAAQSRPHDDSSDDKVTVPTS